MNEQKLRKRKRKRARQRDRQLQLYRETGDQRHLSEFRRHRKAVRYLRRLILRAVQQARPSAHFAYAEFNCHDGTPVPKASYTALDHLCQTYLEPLRKEFGAIFVTSGHRPQPYNRAIGGASMSIHIYDYPGRAPDAVAADIICERGTPSQWAAFLEKLNPGGLCPYPGSGFTHVDNRQRIGWPKARWAA